MNQYERPARHDEQTYVLASQKFMLHLGIPAENDEDHVKIGRALSEREIFKRATELNELLFDMTDEMLDDLKIDFFGDALAERVAAWVIASRVSPRKKIGDAVSFDDKGVKVDGEIIEIDKVQARYTVYAPSLGHVRSGCGTLGRILDFEAIHPLAKPADEFELEIAM